MKAWVEGVGLVAPGLAGWAASRPVLTGQAPWADAACALPAPAELPAAERRRVGMPVRLALAAGFEAVAQSGRAAAELPSVFASSGGDPENVHQICVSLAANAREVSPTRFHNSVHNAPSGYWSIAIQARAASTSLACHDASFGAGLLDAAAQLRSEAPAVVLIAYDSPYPEPLHLFRAIAAPFGVALVLAREAGPRSIAALEIDLVRDGVAAAPLADAGLEHLRRHVPAARSLGLLAALAAHVPAEVSIDFVAGNRVRIGVQPC